MKMAAARLLVLSAIAVGCTVDAGADEPKGAIYETLPDHSRLPEFTGAVLQAPVRHEHAFRLKAEATVSRYGNANAKTELPALIEMYCLPFTA